MARSIGKVFGDAIKDNVVGMVKYGPSTSYSHNRRAAKAARAERLEREAQQHKGGFGAPERGFVDGKPVTFALGWGSKAGHTLLADGHQISTNAFMQSQNHEHYGPGTGPNLNGTSRGKYSGPNA